MTQALVEKPSEVVFSDVSKYVEHRMGKYTPHMDMWGTIEKNLRKSFMRMR